MEMRSGMFVIFQMVFLEMSKCIFRRFQGDSRGIFGDVKGYFWRR